MQVIRSRRVKLDMDKDRTKGTVKEIEGKLQQAKGDLTGSTTDKAEGKSKEVAGKVQKKIGQAKDDVRKAINANS
jgi:uncharacterized protein YjbJ (UPF0337 family)